MMKLFYTAAAVAIQILSVHSFAPGLKTPLSSLSSPQIVQTSRKHSNQLFSTKSDDDNEYNDDLGEVAFVLLAGGTGSRMKANMPKQFLELRGMPILHHSLDLFLNQLPAYAEEKGLRYELLNKIRKDVNHIKFTCHF